MEKRVLIEPTAIQLIDSVSCLYLLPIKVLTKSNRAVC